MQRKLTHSVASLRSDDRNVPSPDNTDAASGLRSSLSRFRGRPLRKGDPRLEGVVRATEGADATAGVILGGGQRPSGGGSADGGAIWASRRALRDGGPQFDRAVGPGGYAWWYIDGISTDGQNAITVILFVGSVFSPYYHWSGRREPEDHCAVNVALYGSGQARWAMTERGRGSLSRTREMFRLGPSFALWDNRTMVISIDEISAPLPRRIRGTVRLTPRATPAVAFSLDSADRHRWRPVAPLCDIAVSFDSPRLNWEGAGYIDANDGDDPLEKAFQSWTWCRARYGEVAIVLYETLGSDDSSASLAIRTDSLGQISSVASIPPASLPPTSIWRLQRKTCADSGSRPSVVESLEDTPFYSRSLIETSLHGQRVLAMHESLSLTRLRMAPVRAMLPFRMPRSRK